MPTLYDQFGRPIKKQSLTKEMAEPSMTGVRNVWHQAVASGMTPPLLAILLGNAAAGDILAYLTLAEEMEERDLHYAAVLHTRKIAVSKIDIQIEASTEDAKDLAIADEVRAVFSRGKGRKLVFGLMDAMGKGYSATEIIWDTSESQWMPKRYEWRDPRFFQFDIETGSELRIRDERDMLNGIQIPPYKFVVHYPCIKSGIPIRGGYARLVAFAHMCKGYATKDWVAFAEVFGMPIRIGKYGPTATKEDQRKLMTAVANIGTDAAAIIPSSMMIEFEGTGNVTAGGIIYKDLAEYMDRQVSKGVLGQTMTTDDGSSRSQAEVHNEVRADILEDDIAHMEQTITEQLVIPWTILNHGAQKQYARAVLAIRKMEDLEKFSRSVTPLVDRGLPVEIAQVLDKFGLEESEDGAAVLHPVVKVGKAESSVMRQLARAMNLAGASTPNPIDELTEHGTGDWRQQMDPVLDPIRALASRVGSFDEFQAGLSGALEQMDATAFAERLAVESFRIRGHGDVEDEP